MKMQEGVDFLKELEPGFLPLPIFEQIARLVRLPIVDVIPVKKVDDKISVGLLKRPSDDRWWPNAWHLPGTIFRATDSLRSAQDRLINEEIKANAGRVAYVNFLVHQSERGTELILVYKMENCVLTKDSPIAWFEVKKLPKNMIESEKKVLKLIVAAN
jgi:ADP-ribose pyrophosphatase YjhB (NUDIX family)